MKALALAVSLCLFTAHGAERWYRLGICIPQRNAPPKPIPGAVQEITVAEDEVLTVHTRLASGSFTKPMNLQFAVPMAGLPLDPELVFPIGTGDNIRGPGTVRMPLPVGNASDSVPAAVFWTIRVQTVNGVISPDTGNLALERSDFPDGPWLRKANYPEETNAFWRLRMTTSGAPNP